MPNTKMTGRRRCSVSGEITCLTGTAIPVPASCVLSYTGTNGVRDGMLPGAVVSQRCTLILHNEHHRFTQGFSLQHARVQLFLHQGENEWPLAVFYVDSISQMDGSAFLTLQGTDGLDKAFEGLWQDDLSYPGTIHTLVNRVMEMAGYEAVAAFPGSHQLINQRPAWGEISLRGVLSYAAQACGCFCMAAADGSICFVPAWQQTEPYEIFPEHTFRYAADALTFGPLNAVSVTLSGHQKDTDPIFVRTDADSAALEQSYCIAENPLFSDAAAAGALARQLLSVLDGMHFTRLQLRWQGDATLQLGRRIRVWDTQGSLTDSVITSLSVLVDHGFSMQCDCTYQAAPGTAGRIFTPSGFINAARLQGEVDGSLLKADSISARQLAAHAVTAEKISAGSITSHHLASAGITTDKLAAGSVTADKLAAGSVTADKLAAGSITAEKIAAGTIGANHIETGTITADQLASGLITAENGLIANGAVGTAQIADGSITDAKIVGLTAGKITAGTLDAAQVNIIHLKADNITAGTLNGQVIPVLGSEKIADGAVSGVKIVNGAVTTDKISEGAVTAAKIVSSAVTADKLAANSVTAQKILAGAITADKLAAHSVTAEKMAAQSVTVNHLSSDVGSSLDLTGNKSIRMMVQPLETAVMEAAGQQMTISFDGGNAIEKEKQSLTARVHVWKNGVDITDDIPKKAFTWEKDSGQDTDAAWTAANAGKTAVTLTRADIGKSCQLKCTVNAEDSYGRFEIVNGELMWTGEDIFHIANGSLFGPDAYMLKDGSVYIKTAPGKMTVTTTAFDHSVLENSGLSITPGGIHMYTGGTFTLDSDNFRIDENGNVTISGTVTAEEGMIGGWKIGPGSLSSGTGTKHVRLSTEDATYAIWAGAEASGNAPFRVARDGTVYLTKLYVTDENGVAQESPVNLRTSYWKMDKAYSRAVKELESKDGTLTIKLYDGTSVNFTKAGFNALELRQEDPQNRGVWLYEKDTHTYNVQKTVYAYNNNEYIGLYSTINETSGTEAYEDGFNDVGISGITRQDADSFTGGADYGTTVYIRAMASNGKTGTQSFRVSGENAYKLGVAAGEQAGYEDGYAAGWAAAKAAITVGGQITEIRNTAANTFFAQGRATAYLGDEAVATGTFGKSQVIQMGQ